MEVILDIYREHEVKVMEIILVVIYSHVLRHASSDMGCFACPLGTTESWCTSFKIITHKKSMGWIIYINYGVYLTPQGGKPVMHYMSVYNAKQR
jgi:hypothetical protein